MVRACFLLFCIFLLPPFGASQLAAEQESELAQGPVSLTDLANFNSSETDKSRPDETPVVGGLNASAQATADSELRGGQTDVKAPAGGEEASQTSVATGRVGRRSISKVGLASIGLNQITSVDSVINSLIWSSSHAEQALALLKATPARGSSAALLALTSAITVQTAVPPKNAGNLAEQLVEARLDWLARSVNQINYRRSFGSCLWMKNGLSGRDGRLNMIWSAVLIKRPAVMLNGLRCGLWILSGTRPGLSVPCLTDSWARLVSRQIFCGQVVSRMIIFSSW